MNEQSLWKRPRAVVLAATLAFGAGAAGFAAADQLGITHRLTLTLANPNEGPNQGFAPVVKKVLPSVVNIASSKLTKMPTGFGQDGQQFQLPDDPFFQQFFGDQFNQNGNGNGNRNNR